MADVFISHAQEDRDTAAAIAEALETSACSVWWDQELLGGETYDEVIEREIDLAKSVIVLWSRHSVASNWVKSEAALGAERGVLVPAILEPVKIPLEFRRKHTIDLSGWQGDPSAPELNFLKKAIGAHLHREVPHERDPRADRGKTRRVAGFIVAVGVAIGLGVLIGSYVHTSGSRPLSREATGHDPATTVSKPSTDPLTNANTLFDEKKWQEAADAYSRYLASSPRDVNAMNDLGICYKELGRLKEALNELDSALAVDPQHWPSLYNRVVLLAFHLKRTSEARISMQHLKELQPNNPDVEKLAVALEKDGG